MKESKALWETAMAGCGEIAKEMGVIAAEFDGIQLRSDWQLRNRNSVKRKQKFFQHLSFIIYLGLSQRQCKTPLELSKYLENLTKALAEHADDIRCWFALNSDFETERRIDDIEFHTTIIT